MKSLFHTIVDMTQPERPIKVLFICYGNRCRSPAAEGYAKKYAADHHLDGIFEFSSAGFNSLFCAAEPDTVHILKEDGIDLTSFSSQNVHRDLILEANYVLTMEGAQRDMIRGCYTTVPGVADKVFTFKEMAGGRGPDPEGSVHDPYDEPIERYRAIMQEIKMHIPWVIEAILQREHKEHYLEPPPVEAGKSIPKAPKPKSYKKKPNRKSQ